MEAQDFRSLQEAYLDVYESSIGNRARNAVADDRLSAEQERTNDSMNRLRAQDSRHRRSTALARAQATIAAKKSENTARAMHPNPRVGGHRIEQVDLYDIILSHLLDEGYAETVESAEAIMVNMSEEWRYDILEEVLDEENERGQRRAAARNMIDRHRTMSKGVSPEDRTGPEGYLRHRAKTERPTTLRNTSSAGQRRAAARNMIDRHRTMSKGVSPEDRTGPEGYLRHRAKTGG